MPGPTRIEAYAIVSADGMLADAERKIPPGLVVEADQVRLDEPLIGDSEPGRVAADFVQAWKDPIL